MRAASPDDGVNLVIKNCVEVFQPVNDLQGGLCGRPGAPRAPSWAETCGRLPEPGERPCVVVAAPVLNELPGVEVTLVVKRLDSPGDELLRERDTALHGDAMLPFFIGSWN